VNGHLFGAGDTGATQARKQRQHDAARRNADRARRDDDAEAGQEPGR
jgi:hypothetical protein